MEKEIELRHLDHEWAIHQGLRHQTYNLVLQNRQGRPDKLVCFPGLRRSKVLIPFLDY